MEYNYLAQKLRYKKYPILLDQKRLIEEHFDNWRCTIDNYKVLKCHGMIKFEGFGEYEVRVEYVAGKEPKTTILSPHIEPSKEIHMYNDHSLCLHYNPDMPWNEKVKVFETTIPWISEWIVFYEIYKRKNIWMGKESPTHMKESDKNVNKNVD